MRVVGTAGHVDHGKSTLVEALTGIDPDRLKEEQVREMTIDLGFAWMTLPSGSGLGIVDVPGHRDFIENMLAGVGAINAAILVVAADEGVMPQTREHLAILDLLEVPRLVVALTKIDLVEDPEWTELLREELAELLGTTRYAEAQVVEVAAVTGLGLGELIDAIERALHGAPEPVDFGRPRLPVDRVFSVSGFGTVVTGTLVDGELTVGQQVELQPAGIPARIRGLQTHRESIERAVPASRVAINLSGVAVDQVARGDVIVAAGSARPTTMLDARVRVWEDAPVAIRHNMQLKLFSGAAQRMAKVRLLGGSKLQPGETGWLQLLTAEPIVVRRGDRLILRRPSPSATLGGGQVADPHPERRHRRNDGARIQQLRALLDGSPQQVMLQALSGERPRPLKAAADFAGLDLPDAIAIVREARSQGALSVLNPERPEQEWELMSAEAVQAVTERARAAVGGYHRKFPVRYGMPRQELRSRIGDESGAILKALLQAGALRERGTRLALPEFEPQLTQSDSAEIERLLDRFRSAPHTPPSVRECLEAVGDELFGYLIESGRLIRVSEAVVFGADHYQQMVDELTALLKRQDSLTVAEARDRFESTRKYALALLEHLDRIGLTYREGDVRRLVRPTNR